MLCVFLFRVQVKLCKAKKWIDYVLQKFVFYAVAVAVPTFRFARTESVRVNEGDE